MLPWKRLFLVKKCIFVVLKRTVFFFLLQIFCATRSGHLAAESVEGTSLTLEGVDDVHSGYGFPLGVLGVGDGVPDDVLEEYLEDSASFFVNQARYAFDSASPGQTSYGGLRDALDVVAENFTVTLGAPLSQSFSTFAAAGHR